MPDAEAVLDLLSSRISEQFAEDKKGILTGDKAVILFVGINGTGKTTTVGKIAKEATDLGVSVILGSADTFRAAAIEQLEVWAKRAGVEMVTRERGSDPASVCYATIERAEELDTDLVLIDTAGRLHTSNDLMEELKKVCTVTRKRSNVPVYVVLVIDATTGQNGLTQAKEFNKFLDLDALIITKLDGTAKGGIALAISKELDLPILKIGVGEKIEDLRNFNPDTFARAFIGSAPSGTEVNGAFLSQGDTVEEDQEEPEVEEISEIHEEPEVEDAPKEPSVEEAPEIQEEPEVEEIPEIHEEPEIEEVPEISEEPEVEETPEIREEPEGEVVEESFEETVEEETEEINDETELEEKLEEEPKKKEGKIRGLFKKLFTD